MFPFYPRINPTRAWNEEAEILDFMRSYFPSVRLQGISLPAPEEQKGAVAGRRQELRLSHENKGIGPRNRINVPIDILINITTSTKLCVI